MSHWDSEAQVIVRWPTEEIPGYPDWERRDCGCCAGVEWGGEYPQECDRCFGNGSICVHLPTGTLAVWPGGPLLGRLEREEAA